MLYAEMMLCIEPIEPDTDNTGAGNGDRRIWRCLHRISVMARQKANAPGTGGRTCRPGLYIYKNDQNYQNDQKRNRKNDNKENKDDPNDK